MNIMGISMGGRGSAACLVRDGRAVAAAREEWFSRVPFDASFPEQAVAFCLEIGGLDERGPDLTVRSGRSEHRIAALSTWLTSLAGRPGTGTTRQNLGLLRRARSGAGERTVPEARAAAAAAFYPSPFEEAAILVVNGPGPQPGCVLGAGDGARLRILAEAPASQGVGVLYAALAAGLGRRYPHDEPALIDLARLGRPRYAAELRRERVEFGADGICRVRDGAAPWLEPPTPSEEPKRGVVTSRELDWARSVQFVIEEALLHAARRLRRDTGLSRLVFGGDAALNPAAAGRLVQEGAFDEVWVPPSPGDAAPGAALDAWYRLSRREREPNALPMPGPDFAVAAIESFLEEDRVPHQRLTFEELCERVVVALADGRTVGWLQGPASPGPRGLGARAVLADPRSPSIRDFLNACVKRRSSFRAVAACIAVERAGELFEWQPAGPHAVLDVLLRRKPRRSRARESNPANADLSLPAALQPDGTVRLHAVDRRVEPQLHRLLRTFAARTGCPVLLCASLCEEGEPVAVAPRDAYAFSMRAELDYFALGPFLIDKRQQPLWEG